MRESPSLSLSRFAEAELEVIFNIRLSAGHLLKRTWALQYSFSSLSRPSLTQLFPLIFEPGYQAIKTEDRKPASLEDSIHHFGVTFPLSASSSLRFRFVSGTFSAHDKKMASAEMNGHETTFFSERLTK